LPITVVKGGKADDNDDGVWVRRHNSWSPSYYGATRYSDDFKKSLPADMFEPGGNYNNSKFKPEAFEKVLTAELERFHELSKKYGIYLEYKLLNLESVESKDA